jgi:hypothetical protein
VIASAGFSEPGDDGTWVWFFVFGPGVMCTLIFVMLVIATGVTFWINRRPRDIDYQRVFRVRGDGDDEK